MATLHVPGPHGISLIRHAEAGGEPARPVLDDLKSLETWWFPTIVASSGMASRAAGRHAEYPAKFMLTDPKAGICPGLSFQPEIAILAVQSGYGGASHGQV